MTDFTAYFTRATGIQTGPHDYQCRLACGSDARADRPDTLQQGTDCPSRLIDIPTGLGKTAAVILAWLWNRTVAPGNSTSHQQSPAQPWPRRLVYCLPMRTLVEQTEHAAREWLQQLELTDRVKVAILMGGEEKTDWDLHPERDAILIGTQDMLLSRALNRGYGMSRYRWPMHFGLLNNDCLWVFDETQLMGVGVETSAQLDAFRQAWPLQSACPTWWMSATLNEARLATVDHVAPENGWLIERLSERERESGQPNELFTASKPVLQCELELTPATKKSHAKDLAKLIVNRHQGDTLTLVVFNRVERARNVFEAITSEKKPLYDRDRVALIHSRFRRTDRDQHETLLRAGGDRIVIATQAVEAGVDVSARLLLTELAPWSSIVQRIGRCNRRAEIVDAKVVWIDVQPKDAKDDLCLPYSLEELDKARSALSQLDDASPMSLSAAQVEEPPVVRPVIRRRDLIDLFDTTPDLCGQDIDISRYIRDGDDTDVQFYWRQVDGENPPTDAAPPHRDELCRVSIGEAAKFLKKRPESAWRWNSLEKQWQAAGKPVPGAVYLVAVGAGGYDARLGWTGDANHKPTPLPRDPGEPEGYADNPSSFGKWESLAEHTAKVVTETDRLAAQLTPTFSEPLHHAARWHDLGKAHRAFQSMLRNGDESRKGTVWAKSESRGGSCERIGFRHELASALAVLLQENAPQLERDLIAYLVAAHHGKIRLSIRSLPNETGDPDQPDRLFARGIWHGDELPVVDIEDLSIPETTLDLSFMRMGEGPHGPSWLARALALRDREDLGPFRLAYLETILRAADARASKR